MPLTHGCAKRKRHTPEFRAWTAARSRCRNPKFQHFHRYGGRGIRFSPVWDDFARFLADMGPKPTPLHTLDRINNDGHYEPGNCRWATRQEQADNRAVTEAFIKHVADLVVLTRARQAAITHCAQGHPFDETNTYVTPKGRRVCRACFRKTQQRRYAKAARQIQARKWAKLDKAKERERQQRNHLARKQRKAEVRTV